MKTHNNTKLKLLYLADIFRLETDEDHALSVYDLIIKLSNFGITVSRQTLYEDVVLLKDYGLNINTNKHANTILYYLVSREFSIAELKLIVSAIQTSQFISPSKSEELIHKLSSLTSNFQAKQLE